MSKIKVGLSAVVVLGAAVLIFLQYQTQQKLQTENDSLRQQIAQLKSSDQDTATANSKLTTSEDFNDLMRLRGEVNALRSQTNQIAKLQDQNQKLRDATTAAQIQRRATTDEQQQQRAFGILQMNTSRQYVLGMINYANDHQGQFPASFDQVSPYFQNSNFLTNMNRFEMVYTGPYTTIANPSAAIVIRETEPWQSNGRWFRTYAFADGHSEVHREDTLDQLSEWEKQHVPVPKNQ